MTTIKNRPLKGEIYHITYRDHFEDENAEDLIITEVGIFLDENKHFYFFAGHVDSIGGIYNRTGIMKQSVQSLTRLVKN